MNLIVHDDDIHMTCICRPFLFCLAFHLYLN